MTQYTAVLAVLTVAMIKCEALNFTDAAASSKESDSWPSDYESCNAEKLFDRCLNISDTFPHYDLCACYECKAVCYYSISPIDLDTCQKFRGTGHCAAAVVPEEPILSVPIIIIICIVVLSVLLTLVVLLVVVFRKIKRQKTRSAVDNQVEAANAGVTKSSDGFNIQPHQSTTEVQPNAVRLTGVFVTSREVTDAQFNVNRVEIPGQQSQDDPSVTLLTSAFASLDS